MKRISIILLLLIAVSFLSANSKKMFEGSKCKEAYLYHFLTQSCSYGDEIGVKILLSQGADVNGKGYKKYADCVWPYEFISPLYVAVTSGQIKIAKILLEAGADPNILQGEGVTALVAAVENENIELIKLLLKYGAKVDMKGLYYKPLKIAKVKRNDKIIKLLEGK
jgi:ankyrin repeat protein